MKRFSRRKFLIVASGTLMWLGLIVSSSFAALSDSATLTGNSVTVGSANLLISNSQASSSTLYEKSREGFSFNLVPGQKSEKYFLLKNTSNGEVPLSVVMSASLTQPNVHLESAVTVEVAPVDSEGNLLADASFQGSTLKVLKDGQVQLDGIIPKGGFQRYRMRVSVNPGLSTPDLNIGYDLVFTGHQQVL